MSKDLQNAVAAARANEDQISADILSAEDQLAGLQAEADGIDSKRAALRTKKQDALADGLDTTAIDAQLKQLAGPFDDSDLMAGLTRKVARLKGALVTAEKARKQAEIELALSVYQTAVANCRTAAQALRETFAGYQSAKHELSCLGGISFKVDGEIDVPFRQSISALAGLLGNG